MFESAQIQENQVGARRDEDDLATPGMLAGASRAMGNAALQRRIAQRRAQQEPRPPAPDGQGPEGGDGAGGLTAESWDDVLAGKVILSLGHKGAAVTAMQEKLTRAGCGVAATGEIGPTTEAAIKSFQAAHGIGQTGQMGPQTAAALEEAIGPKWEEVLGGRAIDLGDRGQAVRKIQELLTGAGYPVAQTGTYGPTTRDLVLKFQKDKSLEPTAKVGPTTAKALEQAADPVYTGTNNDGQQIELVKREGFLMTADTAAAYERMKAAAAAEGVKLEIVDGFRSYDDQVAVAAKRGIYGQGGWAAKPGTSPHGYGKALDLWDNRDYEWLAANGHRFGFDDNVAGEAWHWEYIQ